MGFWIMLNRDDAINGHSSGSKAEKPIAGPFETYDDASTEKSSWRYRRFGCIWYTIVESNKKPPTIEETYEFPDSHYELGEDYY